MSALSLTRRLRPWLWGLAAVGLVVLVAWRVGAWSPSTTSADGTRLDATQDNTRPGLALYPSGKRPAAPELEGTTLDGKAFELSRLTGKVVVINIWGSWCGPCRAETPDLVRLSHEFAGKGVRFVGINTRDDPSSARGFERNFKVPYPSVDDQGGRLLLNFRHIIPSAVVPSSVVIDRDGKVAARVIGRVTYTTLKGLLEDELAAGGGAT